MKKFRISYNAPVVLTFALIAVGVHLLPDSYKHFFVMRPQLESIEDFFALFTHIVGHGNWDHLLSNFTMILLLGPILEERHGSRSLVAMILATSLVTSLLNLFIFKDVVLGASGIVFMFILLASTANLRKREIPLTFIAVAVLFLGRELVAIFENDQISQMAHLIGGVVGAIFGFIGANSNGSAVLSPPKATKSSSIS